MKVIVNKINNCLFTNNLRYEKININNKKFLIYLFF